MYLSSEREKTVSNFENKIEWPKSNKLFARLLDLNTHFSSTWNTQPHLIPLLGGNSKGLSRPSAVVTTSMGCLAPIIFRPTRLSVSISPSVNSPILCLLLCLSIEIQRPWRPRTTSLSLYLEFPNIFVECMVRCEVVPVPWGNITEVAIFKKSSSPYTEILPWNLVFSPVPVNH